MDDHSSASCFACVVLSHGDEDGIWAVDKLAPVLRTEDIMATVNSKCCKTLVNKPKIFIIQVRVSIVVKVLYILQTCSML